MNDWPAVEIPTFYRPLSAVVSPLVEEARENHPEVTISIAMHGSFHTDAIDELDVAVAELLDNAIKHNDASSPEVRVEVDDVTADHGVIRIIDNGPGIPATEQSYLHLDKEIDQLNHGSGLGLVFVYWAIRLSGGSISITDNDPRGSVVKLRLPKA